MPFIIIAIILVVIIFAFIFITPAVAKVSTEKGIEKFLSENTENFTFTEAKGKPYHFDLMVNNHKYAIKIVHIPSFAEVQINDRLTWEVKYGAGDVPGRPQPNRKYLDELRPFLKCNLDLDIQKVIILTPKAKKIVKYINECEIIFVTSKTDVYNVKVINENDYSLFLDK